MVVIVVVVVVVVAVVAVVAVVVVNVTCKHAPCSAESEVQEEDTK